MSVTPADIAVALGRTAPAVDSAESMQWQMWIDDADMLIQARIDSISPTPTVDQMRRDYVVREAVVTQVRRPDDATQVTISVDDASTSKTYRSSAGRVTILDQWWSLLGLTPTSGGAFDIDTVPANPTLHQDWCSLTFGALYCSCGGDIAGYPLYEGGVW